ncbi:MAG: patatin-like phospholipase family protein [Actinomycetia bacterium]|nr:patatin-like phospholipase family protein [Actinomycetes bacterium]
MRVGLVLGSGGARGLAHIGVVDELRARGHSVTAIAGSSMGALVGGVVATGKCEDFKGFMLGVTRSDVVRHLDPMVRAPGLLRGRRMIEAVRDVIGDPRIEDCAIPFTAVASDLVNRREIWLTSGSMLMAIRASIAIPVMFTPIMVGGRLLADGGVLDPLPVDALAGREFDVSVGVSLFGRLGRPVIEPFEAGEADETGRAHEEMAAGGWERLPSGFDLSKAGLLALEVMEAEIQRAHLATARPDVLVEIPADASTFLEFDQASRLIDLGRSLAAAAFDTAGL